MTEKKLTAVGIKRKGEKGFKIRSKLDTSEPPTLPTDEPETAAQAPHLIHNGSGIPNCSVCGTPVHAPQGACTVCTGCGQQFGDACG